MHNTPITDSDHLAEEERLAHWFFQGKWEPFEELQERFDDELANLRPENFLDLDRSLLCRESEEATQLRILMWSTVIDIAEKRRSHALKTLGPQPDTCLDSFYGSPSMPYGDQPSYEVKQDSFANTVLSLPYGDPEYVFEWSKLAKHGDFSSGRKHARVVIETDGSALKVSSDLPVEFLVVGATIKIPEGVDQQAWVDGLNKELKARMDEIALEDPELSEGNDYVKPLQKRQGYAVCEPFSVSPADCGLATE